ncbi:MAG: DUF6206 family protein [Fidelibacterota bacterium]
MDIQINNDLIEQFELALNPADMSSTKIPVRILGYGEISTVFQLEPQPELAFKRMPLFKTPEAAETYMAQYRQYCDHLKSAGLHLPDDTLITINPPERPVVVYIGQQQLSVESFGHHLIHHLNSGGFSNFLARVCEEIQKIRLFNQQNQPEIELAIDGQLSNWALKTGDTDSLYYIDTSTPLFRINGEEQLDPELFLQSAPSFLRWIIRWLFLDDVMNRYYDQRQIFIDLVANLFKEQRADLVPVAITVINNYLPDTTQALSFEEVEKYYKEDRLIWSLFLTFRRLDRWLKTKIFRSRYEFILPGKIRR